MGYFVIGLAGDEAVAGLGRPVVERVVEEPKDGLGQGEGGAVLRIGRLQLEQLVEEIKLLFLGRKDLSSLDLG